MRKTVIGTLMAAAFIAGMLTACDDNKNNNSNWNGGGGLGSGVTINVEGAVAEGGDGGDGGNVANQGGQIGQDGSAVIDAELGLVGM